MSRATVQSVAIRLTRTPDPEPRAVVRVKSPYSNKTKEVTVVVQDIDQAASMTPELVQASILSLPEFPQYVSHAVDHIVYAAVDALQAWYYGPEGRLWRASRR